MQLHIVMAQDSTYSLKTSKKKVYTIKNERIDKISTFCVIYIIEKCKAILTFITFTIILNEYFLLLLCDNFSTVNFKV